MDRTHEDTIELLSVDAPNPSVSSTKRDRTCTTYIVPEVYDHIRQTERNLWYVLNPIPSLATVVALGLLSRIFQDPLADTLCIPNGNLAFPGSLNIWKAEYGFSHHGWILEAHFRASQGH